LIIIVTLNNLVTNDGTQTSKDGMAFS